MRRVHGKLNLTVNEKTGAGDIFISTVLDVLQKGMVNGLSEMAPAIQQMPEKHRYLTKHFRQFTGNTVSSYTAAVVSRGAVVSFVQDEGAPIVHEIVKSGETVHLDDPVEGRPRTVTGAPGVPDTADYGYILAEERADEYAKAIKGAGIVLVPGVAYAPGLEDIWANTHLELENYAKSSKFAWHIRKCIAQSINNFGK